MCMKCMLCFFNVVISFGCLDIGGVSISLVSCVCLISVISFLVRCGEFVL